MVLVLPLAGKLILVVGAGTLEVVLPVLLASLYLLTAYLLKLVFQEISVKYVCKIWVK